MDTTYIDNGDGTISKIDTTKSVTTKNDRIKAIDDEITLVQNRYNEYQVQTTTEAARIQKRIDDLKAEKAVVENIIVKSK
jgi:hypothetical protein